jgi:hypothetical protein
VGNDDLFKFKVAFPIVAWGELAPVPEPMTLGEFERLLEESRRQDQLYIDNYFRGCNWENN